MKKRIYLLGLLAGLSSLSHAQNSGFTTHDSLDVNNISSWLLLHGNMWWDMTTGSAKCTYPKGSGKNIAFASAIWLSGYDNNNILHVSEETYGQDGLTYWPGPVCFDTTYAVNHLNAQNWARFWKLNRTTVDSFVQQSSHTLANTAQTILDWPAKGNPYAKGANGASLTITYNMAPFVDVNGDGSYNPLYGDYPAIKGDQMLWSVFNDMGTGHSVVTGLPLGVEVYCSAYAYNNGSITDNVQYYDFLINNKSANDYHGSRLAMWSDIDLGYGFDDYIGYDSARRLAIAYNAKDTDLVYGTTIPIVGIGIANFPGDGQSGALTPAGSFMPISNGSDLSNNSIDPQNDTEVNHYMHSSYRDGTPLPGNALYAFPDDPSNPNGNSECALHDQPYDRRFVIATNDLTLPAGGSANIGMVLMVTPDGGACPNASFTGITQVADSAYVLYNNPTAVPFAPTPVTKLMVYPNPAGNTLHVAITGSTITPSNISVYDVLGKNVSVPAIQTGSEFRLNTSSLTPGIYQIQVTANGQVWNGRFVK